VLAEKKKKALPYVHALRERGAYAKYIRLSKISLVSRNGKTIIKAKDQELPRCDAIFIQARLSLAPFIEPLLEALKERGCYINLKEGSYFSGFNEPYQFVLLATGNIPSPRTLSSGSGKNIERVSKKISYPLIAKSFKGKTVQQSIVVNSDRELNSFVNSIKSEIDGFMLREFIEDDVVSCVVIGDGIFAVKRKLSVNDVMDIDKGTTYRPTDEEKRIAISAAQVCGYDVARVDLVKGRVVKVEPNIPLEAFNKVCAEKIEDYVASYVIAKAEIGGSKRNLVDDLIEIKGLFSRTILGRWRK